MMHQLLHDAARDALAMGPAVLVQGMKLRRPMDVAQAKCLSVDDKRTILASWTSDFYAVDSQPALRYLPGTPGPVSIDEVQLALREIDRRYGC
ncbi:hypothetical protein E0H93_36105 [Rhizobium leguminosarum bv. viciae]|nr:hypothetical protein [Rhizobium leguminosarum]TBY18703.1 hypothetical protein E0H55_36585 [Rhizobium leguminosarum bv. viciae]TBZ56526.1 hypothetical protein E0H64_36090 [Rhizobium leguminosarum bv. viciae]TCA93241.1 hypothetical protein E0H93_36105 [Rhizobium leguminosarum bv. viciae]